MQIVVLANASQKQEITNGAFPEGVIWTEAEQQFLDYRNADAFIDLGFVNDYNRILILQQLLPKPVIINSVETTLKEIHSSFVRINGWNTFLSSPTIEAATLTDSIKLIVQEIFAVFGKKIEWVRDQPGLIAPRTLTMIVNEALITLQEDISTKEEIDTAMQLGTAYPYGPLQWAEKIGLSNIRSLIKRLKETGS